LQDGVIAPGNRISRLGHGALRALPRPRIGRKPVAGPPEPETAPAEPTP
jgi:hypothetical protein